MKDYKNNITLKMLASTAIVLLILVFTLPGNAAQIHRVAPGENLSLIAQKHEITLQELMKRNGYLRYPDRIFPGQPIIVPEPEPEIDEEPEQPEIPETPAGEPPAAQEPKPSPEPPQLSISELRRIFSDRFFLMGPSQQAKVALTFDDGPDSTYTPQVLDILKEYHVPATFFLIGSEVDKYPRVTRQIAAEGHVIGSHTWSHPDLRQLARPTLALQMIRTREAIEETTGLRPRLMRPPYGAVDMEALERLIGLDYYIINWSVDSVDWRDREVDSILVNTLTDVRPGAIILLHSAGGGECRGATVDVLPELIEVLHSQGYTFVTVDELLEIPPYR